MVYKNLICSDIHDDVEALQAFADFAQAEQADRIFLLGDLSLRPYTRQHLDDLMESTKSQGFTKELVEKFIKDKKSHNKQVLDAMKGLLDKTGIDYLVIPGNYDSSLNQVFGEKDLHLKTANLGEARLGGYGGADAFPEHILLLVKLNQIQNFDHNELYKFLKQEQPEIGIIHNPPRGFCDDMFNGDNVGTTATTKYILENSPKLILSGHIHEAGPNGNNPHGTKGIAGYQNQNNGKRTIVVNPGNLGRFEIINESLDKVIDFDHGTFSRVDTEEDGTPIRVVHYSIQPKEQVGQRGIKRTLGNVRQLANYNL